VILQNKSRNGKLRSMASRLSVAAFLAVLPRLGVAGPVEEFQSFDDQLSAAHDAYGEALEKIVSEGGAKDGEKAKALPDPRPDLLKKIERMALTHLGKPDGARMAISAFQWSWILDYDLDRLPERFGRITEHYPEEEALDDVLPEAGYFGTRVGSPDEWLAPIEELLKRTSRKDTKLSALMARGQIELGQGQITTAKATFSGVLGSGNDTDFVKDAKGFIFEIERLQTGMVAPDFTAKTLDGKSVSLKSLRGKAVLLNFWASW